MQRVQSDVRGRGRPSYDREDEVAAENFLRISRGFAISREAPEPMWLQLKNQIGRAIEAGDLPAESRLPSEQALCALLEVSRPVVRAAIAALSEEGRVIKKPRKGMFISPKRYETDFLSSNISASGDMRAKGFKVSADTLEYLLAPASARERQYFNLGEEGSVIRIKRIYRMNGRPITLSWISLPAAKVPEMEKFDIDNQSIYETIRVRYGIEVKRADRWFTAALPSEEAVRLMGVAPGAPLIVIESLSYDQSGEPIEFYYSYYDSNFARVHVSV